MQTRTRQGPRQRLIESAKRLTYTHGANVGVDAILTDAKVARRSLYEHFGGKDGLLAEVLRSSSDEDLSRYREVMNAAGDNPRQRLLAIFDDIDTVRRQPDFRGCRYLAADLALADTAHPAHAVTADYRREVHQLLKAELVRLGNSHPAAAADQLHLLIEGALATGSTRPDVNAGSVARQLAVGILGPRRRTASRKR